MPKLMSITFLGTSSGGGPTLSRTCSSLTLNLEGTSWLVDCAEGTQLQLLKAKRFYKSTGRVSKIFVTHLHVDHCSGIAPFMSNTMSRIHNLDGNPSHLDNMLRLELYGPSGLRKLVRTNLQITRTLLRGKYAAHELLFAHDTPTSCDDQEMHENEVPGRDIRIDNEGFWRDFEDSHGIQIDAGPIIHRVPCIGYIFKERPMPRITEDYLKRLDAIPTVLLPIGIADSRDLLPALKESQVVHSSDGSMIEPPPLDIPGRKIVILGDTSDPWAIAPLAHNASLLVHEATNAWLPPALDKGRYRGPEEIRLKAISRGHSTPDMAGKFANAIRARRLVLNHFSARYQDPGPRYKSSDSYWARVIEEIEDQASRAWKMGRAVAANDLLEIDIPTHELSE